jgi:hypothetical protein
MKLVRRVAAAMTACSDRGQVAMNFFQNDPNVGTPGAYLSLSRPTGGPTEMPQGYGFSRGMISRAAFFAVFPLSVRADSGD